MYYKCLGRKCEKKKKTIYIYIVQLVEIMGSFQLDCSQLSQRSNLLRSTLKHLRGPPFAFPAINIAAGSSSTLYTSVAMVC